MCGEKKTDALCRQDNTTLYSTTCTQETVH